MNRQDRAHAFLQRALEAQAALPVDHGLMRDLFAGTGDDSRLSLSEVGELVSRDPSLAVRILSLANSAYYGLQAEVTTVGRAVTVLGMREVRNLVLALGFSSVARMHPLPDRFCTAGYWLHQLRVAAFCRIIAAGTEDLDPEMLYTAGLLHDIGKLFIAALAPDDWLGIRRLARQESLPDCKAEERWWGLDHALAGARVLAYWQLPAALTEPISWHHGPHFADAAHARGAGAVQLADALLLAFERGTPPPAAALQLLKEYTADAGRLQMALEAQFAGERIGQLAALLG
ncbi:putative signal transduction protein [Oleidesulfovibrio alaskensis G20]|uniref:Putative signal transduction protein n=1 Tax=Oleidesulfovibrio alaskensis (strain ATCC BAA-1058 / DSM 17464 / G20) TaxID=207559 RepID=Q30XT4_OLEA2|nr:HDOD domain-containing protein [Oleidesulfovibrio alaskensis]ABB39512.2 putative signal transduction protein [Oleidesulfovibrio alaskensis G20]MBG0772421.1 HDOD domain-containing protein [Oleidesulfovibrio alaskensis]MBL3582217.1 HDOD domain-containing protein [Oleidesulfovibrio alaskensis]